MHAQLSAISHLKMNFVKPVGFASYFSTINCVYLVVFGFMLKKDLDFRDEVFQIYFSHYKMSLEELLVIHDSFRNKNFTFFLSVPKKMVKIDKKM